MKPVISRGGEGNMQPICYRYELQDTLFLLPLIQGNLFVWFILYSYIYSVYIAAP